METGFSAFLTLPSSWVNHSGILKSLISSHSFIAPASTPPRSATPSNATACPPWIDSLWNGSLSMYYSKVTYTLLLPTPSFPVISAYPTHGIPNEDSIQLHCSECTCAHAHATTRYSQTAPISQSLSIFRLTFTLRLPVPLLRTTLAPTSRIPSTFALSRPLVHSYPVPFYLLSPQHTGKSFPYQNTYARSFFYNFFSCGISCIRKSHKS